MPRYYFNVVEGDGRDLIRDSEGIAFVSVSAARKEALGLARDIARHRLHGPVETWKIVVADENGAEILTVPFSGIPARRLWIRFDPSPLLARLKHAFRARPYVTLAAAAGLGIIVEAALTSVLTMKPGGSYQTASAPAGDAVVAVRFVAQASPEAIAQFLASYQASVVGSPRPGGFYRLRITDPRLPKEELANIVSRMTRESVVEFAAAVE